jgi:hypothetical protein
MPPPHNGGVVKPPMPVPPPRPNPPTRNERSPR